ncbi:hypothetical protein HKX48_004801 [Thoreauomyces humboldtii]|nr:hypothetical protein HKX48_004801 [Thoreauomyces humboldtii]
MDAHEIAVSLGSENTISRLSALEALRAELGTRNGLLRWQDHSVAGDLLSRVAWTLCDKEQKVAFESFQFLLELIPACLRSCEDVVEVAIIPAVIANLGDTKLQIRRQATRVLELYLQYASSIDSFLESLVHYGLESEDWRARKESAAAIPTLLTRNIPGVKWLPLVSALVLRLQDISDVVIKASLAALRHVCLSNGEEGLAKLVNMLPGLSRQIFKRFETRILNGKTLDQLTAGSIANLGMHTNTLRNRSAVHEEKIDVPPPSLPLPSPPASTEGVLKDVSFGAVPTILVNELRVETDWRRRSMAADSLQRYISNIERIEPIVPHMREFIEFMRTLIEDAHFRIAITALQAFGEFVSKAGPHIVPFLGITTDCFVAKLGDNKLALRQTVTKAILRLMQSLNPEAVLLLCLEHAGTENSRAREEIVNLVPNAILLFPDAGWNYPLLISHLVTRLDDTKPRVKLFTVEAFAVLAAMIQPDIILQLVRGLGVDEDIIQLLEIRFSDPSLPQLNSDRLLEHLVSRSSMNTPLPLSASPSRDRTPSALSLTASRSTTSKSAPSLTQPFLAQHDLGSSETVLQTHVRALDRALSASSQSELIPDGQPSRGNTAKPVKMPWERPRSNAANRFSYHGDMQRAIDESMSTVRRVRSFSESQELSQHSEYDHATTRTHEISLTGGPNSPDRLTSSRTLDAPHPSMVVEGHGPPNPRGGDDPAFDRQAPPDEHSGTSRTVPERLLVLNASDTDLLAEGPKDQFPVRRSRFRPSMTPGPNHFSKANTSCHTPTPMSGEESGIRHARESSERDRFMNGISPAAEVPPQDAPTSSVVTNRPLTKRVSMPTTEPSISCASSLSEAEGRGAILLRANSSPLKKLSSGRDQHPPPPELPASAPCLPTAISRRSTLNALESSYTLALQQLRGNPDWNVKVQALETVKMVLDEQPHLLVGNLHDLILAVVGAVHNLRSSVSKHAITILHGMYVSLGKAMEADLDLTVGALMKKVGEGTGFILEEVDRALLAMTIAVSPTRAVGALLLHSEHRNPVVRMRVACLCHKVVTDMSPTQAARYVQSYGDTGRLFTALVLFLREGMAETRNAAKRIIVILSDMPEFNRVLEKVLAIKQANEIREALKSSLKTGKFWLCSF